MASHVGTSFDYRSGDQYPVDYLFIFTEATNFLQPLQYIFFESSCFVESLLNSSTNSSFTNTYSPYHRVRENPSLLGLIDCHLNLSSQPSFRGTASDQAARNVHMRSSGDSDASRSR